MNIIYLDTFESLGLLPKGTKQMERGFQLGHSGLNILISLIPQKYKDHAQRLLSKWRSEDYFLVGLQIRMGGGMDAWFNNNPAAFFTCARYIVNSVRVSLILLLHHL